MGAYAPDRSHRWHPHGLDKVDDRSCRILGCLRSGEIVELSRIMTRRYRMNPKSLAFEVFRKRH